MPSRSLQIWHAARLPRLSAVEGQAAAPGQSPALAAENLRALVVLLSAQFQGFCRDLHTECGQALADAVPAAAQPMVLTQCQAARGLDGGNARYEVIRDDFRRFEVDITPVLKADPANDRRVTDLGLLNQWRNYISHDKPSPPAAGGPLALATVLGWRASCDGLAVALDALLYTHFHSHLGTYPW